MTKHNIPRKKSFRYRVLMVLLSAGPMTFEQVLQNAPNLNGIHSKKMLRDALFEMVKLNYVKLVDNYYIVAKSCQQEIEEQEDYIERVVISDKIMPPYRPEFKPLDLKKYTWLGSSTDHGYCSGSTAIEPKVRGVVL